MLYHGTSTRFLKSILENGITPRRDNQNNNWVEQPQNQSKNDRVYLTKSYGYALFYSEKACSENLQNDCAVIIEVSMNLHELEQDDDVEAIGKKHISNFRTDGAGSLKVMGTCSHIGKISPARFRRIFIIFDHSYVMNFASDGFSPLGYLVQESIPHEKEAKQWLKEKLIKLGAIEEVKTPFKIDWTALQKKLHENKKSWIDKALADDYRSRAYPEMFKIEKQFPEHFKGMMT